MFDVSSLFGHPLLGLDSDRGCLNTDFAAMKARKENLLQSIVFVEKKMKKENCRARQAF
jgi:hypothetical protein